jgi:hypothetical protein
MADERDEESRSQRWRERRDHWVPNATEINPAEFAVDVIDDYRQAKPFVEAHHYSGSFPAARLSVGLFRGARLVGVAVYSVGMSDRAVPKHTGLDAAAQACDLGRFVLLDEVAGNGETWFARRAFSLLRQAKPEILSVISYADPLPRLGVGGQLVKPGHVGAIYQQLGAIYRGRATPRTEYLTPDGQPFSARALQKIRKLEQGYAYAIDELIRRGAPPAQPGEHPARWLQLLMAGPFFTRRRHPGNHVYVFPRTQAAKIAAKPIPSLAYPERLAA